MKNQEQQEQSEKSGKLVANGTGSSNNQQDPVGAVESTSSAASPQVSA